MAQPNSPDIRWDKAACRFCRTSCSVLVDVKHGRAVAT
ncbi:hypothetical protein [Aliiroseovarius sp. F47248L]|nr:hypothetical protein [Aliiroseovarius sp. F47248L]MCK0137882.1 hypothetical protein [Aliiroseovarius sp. F47248L]